MITVGDVMNMRAFDSIWLAAPCEGAAEREVTGVGTLDHEPFTGGYEVFTSGEFVFTTLGFAGMHPDLAEEALLALIEYGVAAVAVKPVVLKELPPSVAEASTARGVPVFFYEGRYMERVIADLMNLLDDDAAEWEREDFQLVAFREAVAAQEVEVVRVAGDDVRDVHGLLFVAVVGGGLLRLGEVEARAVGAVGDGQKLVSHLIGRFAVKHAAIGAHDRSHVERLLVAALDLDGIDSRISQRLQVRKHVKIFRVHNEGAAVVLLNGKEFAGPLFLFQKELHGSPRRELRRGGL